jgi:hypothetical protein
MLPLLTARIVLRRPCRWLLVLPFVITFGAEPLVAQSIPPQSSSPSQSPTPPEAKYGVSGKFQARIDEAARALRDNPQLKNLSPRYLQGLAEFVSGNMLFVLLHEMAHATITQMGLPVLGKMEDAADSFAALRLIRVGSDFSHHVLMEAAKGLFLADRRNQKGPEGRVAPYDEHGLNRQRAYQIVCLMFGSDEEKFKDLASETKLPEASHDHCAGDYSNAAYSWDLVLKSHRRAPDQPKTKLDVVYGPADGRAAIAQQVARSIRLLETVAEHAADEFAWPAPFTLELQGCGFPNARWDLATHKLTLCYELAAEFADLYRDYADARADGSRTPDSWKRNTIGVFDSGPQRRLNTKGQ